jgi:Tfp pilus assembly PilM family ATPase
MALPGDMLTMRVLELPFADVRKVEQVVGYESEGQIVHALQDLVYDHSIVPSLGSGSAALAVAAKSSDVGSFLETLKAHGCEPRSLFAAPVIYQAVAGRAGVQAGFGSCQMLLDIGHARTNVCVLVDGKTVFARTLTRGGAALTAAVVEALGCTEAEAEQAKHQHGFLSSTRATADGAVSQRIEGFLREAMVPWLRDLRQTLASVRARVKMSIDSILITGGGASLGGLADFIEDELELPVSAWDPAGNGYVDGSPTAVTTAADSDILDEPATTPSAGHLALATAIGWAGARGGKQIDLRRGPFLYRASISIVREKAAHLVALGVALLVSATIDGTMALARLDTQKAMLTSQLKAATQELFGVPRMDAKGVTAELKKSFRDEMAPIPKATAFDLLDQISRRMPSAEKIKLDIHEIDIRPKKLSINGTIDSAAAVDEIVTKLGDIDCFEDITKGAITESGGAKKFVLTIASKCP